MQVGETDSMMAMKASIKQLNSRRYVSCLVQSL